MNKCIAFFQFLQRYTDTLKNPKSIGCILQGQHLTASAGLFEFFLFSLMYIGFMHHIYQTVSYKLITYETRKMLLLNLPC